MKSKLFLPVIIMMTFSQTIFGQTWKWAVAASGNGVHMSINSCTDKQGNTYAIGCFMDTLNFSGNISMVHTVIFGQTFRYNVFVVKYDVNGSAVWAQQIHAVNDYETFHITCDAAGNIYAAFTFNDSIAVNNIYTVSNGVNDIIVVCFNADGNILWQKIFGSSSLDLIRLLIPAQDGFLIGGTLYNRMTIDNEELIPQTGTATDYLIRFNSSGQMVWNEKAFNASIDAVTLDQAENIFLSGRFIFSAVIGDTAVFGTNNSIYLYCIKQNQNRQTQWINITTGNDFVRAASIASDNFGNLFVSGTFRGEIFVDKPYTSYNKYSSFLLALSAQGENKWSKKDWIKWNHGTAAFCIRTDSKGYIYLINSSNNWNFQGDEFLSPVNYEYSFITKHDINGNTLWIKDLRSYNSAAGNISLDNNDNVYLTGFFLGKGLALGNFYLQKEHDGAEMFTARIDADEIIPASPVFDSDVTLYPNPAVSGMNVFISADINLNNSLFSIYNSIGQKIFEKKNPSSNIFFINTSEFSGGIYSYRLNNDEGIKAAGKFAVK